MAAVDVCRKFAPNIFNKNKCSACFGLKEDHSASAIELNKASRKISKCGYLFVAPDWDFSNPINRTKRWQRRWFVLYDDGELTYSVDDHPETIPQACIDMNKVMEVARADDVTGNPFSVAITAPDRVHFVKGTCKEESAWWLEVLQIFPRSSIKTGRAKRNATFPGGISTTYMAQYSGTALQTPPVKCSDNVSPAEEVPESLPVSVTLPTTTPIAVGLPPTARPRERAESGGRSDGSQRYKKIKSTKVLEPGTRAYRSLRSNTCENLSAIPAEYTTPKSRYAKLEAEPDFNPEPVEPAVVVQPIIQIDSPGTEEEEEVEETKTCQVTAAPEQPPSPPPQLLSRGEPDGGCGLDPSLQLPTSPTPTKFGDSLPTKLEASTHSIPTIPVPSPHELLNCKKGWLMKQGPGGEWQKHWFVLQGSALMYFSGSDESDLDGIIDLGLVQKVEVQEVARNYGFIVSTLDDRKYFLSAVTNGIRKNWISALRTAACLPETDIVPKLTRRETIDAVDTSRICSRATTTASPPLARTATSRVKKGGGRSEASRLKTSHSLSILPLTSDVEEAKQSQQPTSMVAERDTAGESMEVVAAGTSLGALAAELSSLQTQLQLSQAELMGISNGSGTTSSLSMATSLTGEGAGDSSMARVKLGLVEATEVLHKQSTEVSNLRKKLDNMNSDMDATLKNLNDEHIKIKELEQANALLQIKASNGEKSLREQSKEITSLNGRVKEFSDLSSQYKAQIVENKTLRQKLERLERMREGPNWKALYEGLQEQHSKEREMWEGKLQEMEQEMHELQDSNNEADQKGHIIADLSHQLQESEQRINQLVSKSDSLNRDNANLKSAYEDQITGLKENIKELEEYIDKTDADKNESESSKDSEIMRLREELTEKCEQEKVAEDLREKLYQTETELERVTQKLEDSDSAPARCGREATSLRLPRMDSLTELMLPPDELQMGEEQEKLLAGYNDAMKRLGKAVAEIKALRGTVKTSQNSADEMELVNIRLQQSLASLEVQQAEQVRQMSTKIEDLTGKYLASERQVRTLKLKGADGKSRRRSSTGIRPEEFLVNKEAEHVLEDIESSLVTIEGMVRGKDPLTKEGRRKSYETSTKASRARRRSSESSEMTFVDRLKKTEKTITELNRKLSTQADQSSGTVEGQRRQLLGAISKCRQDLANHNNTSTALEDLDRLLASIENLPLSTETPVVSVLEPVFPKSEEISSHLDTVMTFLFKCVETSHELRMAACSEEATAGKLVSLHETGSSVSTAVELARALQAQDCCLQAHLLLDLQLQIANSQTKFFAHKRDQSTKDYDLVTKTMLLKLLEKKQFLPLSSYSAKKLATLANLDLGPANLESMFRRLQGEAHQVFASIGSITQDLIGVLTDAVLSKISNKDSIVENIRSEVLNLIEENERLQDFQTGVVNIFLIGAETETGRDPERINLMTNREDALQSQAEVARILIEQEIQDLANAMDVKIECMEKDSVFLPTKEFPDVDNLSQCVFKISSMMGHKCITEAQITILNTILGCTELVSPDQEMETPNTFVFNPDNMESECNEFMLVLNNYRQQSHSGTMGSTMSSPKYSNASNGEMLETNLKSIRKENENKKARLSAALEDKRVDTEASGLRSWCEKSMTAMEKSYESLLHDLQTQHSKEKESLKREKETALAEETQATLAALDAMRKAHESEVQKEVEKFKKEFLAEFKANACIGALQSEYQSDRAEIKREILSVTSGDVSSVGWGEGSTSGEEARSTTTKLTRSPSCPRLYSSLSLSTTTAVDAAESEENPPLRSPLSGMVANRKRVFESDC